MHMAETALGRLVGPLDKQTIAEDAVLRVLWILRTHPQNESNEFMDEVGVARATLLPLSVASAALARVLNRGLVEMLPGRRHFRLTQEGERFVGAMAQGLRSVL